MEEIKSSVRTFSNKQQHHQSLTGNTKHYRLTVASSQRRQTAAGPAFGQDISDAYFDVSTMFPSSQTDLLNGEWEIFLEDFNGFFGTYAALGMKVCLPDLIKSSHSYVGIERGNVSLAVMDDSVAYIPSSFETLAVEVGGNIIAGTRANGGIVNSDIGFHQTITKDAVGHKIDPMSLFSGEFHVTFRNGEHTLIQTVAGPGNAGQFVGVNVDGWIATFLIVHKS